MSNFTRKLKRLFLPKSKILKHYDLEIGEVVSYVPSKLTIDPYTISYGTDFFIDSDIFPGIGVVEGTNNNYNVKLLMMTSIKVIGHSYIYIPPWRIKKFKNRPMGLLKNKPLLDKLIQYITNTNFGTQTLGHNITLSFLPPTLVPKLVDKRYSFTFQHRSIGVRKYEKVTFSEVILTLIKDLNENLKYTSKDTIDMYESAGLIENGVCTKELISSVIALGIAVNPVTHIGNTTNKHKYTDNLSLLFPEFEEPNVDYFLTELDNYKPEDE